MQDLPAAGAVFDRAGRPSSCRKGCNAGVTRDLRGHESDSSKMTKTVTDDDFTTQVLARIAARGWTLPVTETRS